MEDVVEKIQQKLEACRRPEEKLTLLLDSCREMLSQEKEAKLSLFWKVRSLCFPLFDEVHPAVRSQFWSQLWEVTNEAKALRNYLNEQVNFTKAQIELALTSLEEAMNSYEESAPSSKLSAIEEIRTCQGLITNLKQLAKGIHTLRLELIQAPIRTRAREELFRRIAALGDRVFPYRSRLVDEMSTRFMSMVDRFVQLHFAKGPSGNLFGLQEEIKSLQSLFRELTLRSDAFSQAQERLNQCWDQIKEARRQKKREHEKEEALAQSELKGLKTKLEELLASSRAPRVQLKELKSLAGSLQFGQSPENHPEKQPVKQLLSQANQKIQARIQQEKKSSAEALHTLQEKIAQLMGEEGDVDSLVQEKEACIVQMASLLPEHQQELAPSLEGLTEAIEVVSEKKLILLPCDDDPTRADALQQALQRRCDQRLQCQEHLKQLNRKKRAGGLSMEQALHIEAKIERVGSQLVEIEGAIQSFEDAG